MQFSKQHILSSLFGVNSNQSYEKKQVFQPIPMDKCRNIVGGINSGDCGSGSGNNETQPNDPPLEGEDEI